MLEEFVEFVQSIFPGIDPYVAERCLEAIKQHKTPPSELVCEPVGPGLCQGDIIEGLDLLIPGKGGLLRRYHGLSMIISNSCDLDNKPTALVAPCFDLRRFEEDSRLSIITKNLVTNFLCLPSIPDRDGVVVDLSMMNPQASARVAERLKDGAIRRICSLSNLGYYLLLSKLTVHLMRPESEEVIRPR